MRNTLNKIQEEYGSVEECVKKLGFMTADGIEELRRNLIVDESATGPVDWREHEKLVVKEEEEPSPEELKPSSTS